MHTPTMWQHMKSIRCRVHEDRKFWMCILRSRELSNTEAILFVLSLFCSQSDSTLWGSLHTLWTIHTWRLSTGVWKVGSCSCNGTSAVSSRSCYCVYTMGHRHITGPGVDCNTVSVCQSIDTPTKIIGERKDQQHNRQCTVHSHSDLFKHFAILHDSILWW